MIVDRLSDARSKAGTAESGCIHDKDGGMGSLRYENLENVRSKSALSDIGAFRSVSPLIVYPLVFVTVGDVLVSMLLANVMGDALSRNEKVKSRRVRGMIPAAQSEAFKQENVLAERLHGLEQQMKRKGDKNFLLYGSNLGSMERRKNVLEMRLDLGVCLAFKRIWTKERNDSDFGGYNEGMLLVIWAEIRESSLIGPELVLETTYKVVLIKEKLKAARDRQKSYVDFRRKPLESEVGDRVLLKVSPWKGVVHFGKKGKLPEELIGAHDTFHVSNLKKRLGNANLHVPLNEIKIDKTLRFVEEPVEIMDHEIKSLKRSRIPFVKVHWNSKHGPEFTWGREVYMKSKYPQLFVDRAVEPTNYVDNFGMMLVLQLYTLMFTLEDEHVFPVEEQPLPPVVSPMLDSSGDDADDEDEDEEEEEHLASADSTVIVPTVEPVSPPEGTEPVIAPPSTDISTTGARITVRLQASISFPPKAKVHSPAFCTSSPPPVPSPLLPSSGGPNPIQYYGWPPKALIDASYLTPYHHLHYHTTTPSLLTTTRMISDGVVMDYGGGRPMLLDKALGSLDGYRVSGDPMELQTTVIMSNVQTARPCFYADFMKCQPLNFKGTEGVVGLTRWIEKMESVFNISGCAIENQVKFATCTLLGAALTWWNGQIRTLGPEAYSMTWEVLKKKMTDKYCPQGEIKKLEIELWNLKVKGNDVPTYTERFQELTLICTKFVANETKKVDKYISGLPDNIYGNVKSARPKTLDETIELANDLMDQKLRTYAERQSDNKRKADDSSRNNHGHQQQPFKRQNVAKVYNIRTGEKKPYGGSLPKCTKCHFHHNGPCTQKCHKCNKVGHFARDCRSSCNKNVANTQKGNGTNPKGNGCFECGAPM
ncbi:putative reverse transcriptase domain-containing protein [Tanacetum coccineum]